MQDRRPRESGGAGSFMRIGAPHNGDNSTKPPTSARYLPLGQKTGPSGLATLLHVSQWRLRAICGHLMSRSSRSEADMRSLPNWDQAEAGLTLQARHRSWKIKSTIREFTPCSGEPTRPSRCGVIAEEFLILSLFEARKAKVFYRFFCSWPRRLRRRGCADGSGEAETIARIAIVSRLKV